MRPSKTGSIAAMGLALVAAISCASSTRWVSTWVEPGAAGKPKLRKILVVGMSQDLANRRLFEDALVTTLRGYKVDAVPSYGVLPEGDLSEEAFRAQVKKGGFDGVILTRLVDVREKTEYVPSTTTVGVAYGGWGPYWSGYYGWHTAVYSPGYLVSSTIVRLQTRLWATAGDGTPVWTGISESADPGQVATLCREVAFMVGRDLSRCGLI